MELRSPSKPRRSTSKRGASRLIALALGITLAACGSSSDSGGATAAGDPSAASAPVAAIDAPLAELLGPEPYASTTFGALHGEVRVEGEAPARFPIGARQQRDCTAHADVEHLSDIIVVNDGKLQGAFVQIVAGHEDAEVPAPPSEAAVMDQRGCIYTPHVLAMQKGQTLKVSNSDPATHNVNVKAPRNNASKNLSMVKGQAPLEFEMRRAEEVTLKCDIHPWMSAVVHVAEHPWFAVTDAAGSFHIPDVPPGEYVVEVVHERLGRTSGRVVVEAGSSSGFVLTLTAD